MDPNANLEAQAALLEECDDMTRSRVDRVRLRELREALATWLSHGGFEPDWETFNRATKAYRKWVRNTEKFADLYR